MVVADAIEGEYYFSGNMLFFTGVNWHAGYIEGT